MDHPIEHFCCQNPDCRDRGVRGQGNLWFCGWSGEGKRIRMIYSRTCKARFSERKGTVLSQSRLADEKAYAREVPRPKKPGPGRWPKPDRVVPEDLCYATVCKTRKHGRVVEGVRSVVFGTATLLAGTDVTGADR
jgi:hypothetical protein